MKDAKATTPELFAVETFRGITADGEEVRLNGTDENDSWLVMGSVIARNEGRVEIDLKDGSDSLRVFGSIEAHQDSTNQLHFGGSNNVVTIASNLSAIGGSNQISGHSEDGDNVSANDTVSIGGTMLANDGVNSISLFGGGNSVRIEKGMTAENWGNNYIRILDHSEAAHREGDNSIYVGGDIKGHADIMMAGRSSNSLTVTGDLKTTDNSIYISIESDEKSVVDIAGSVSAVDTSVTVLMSGENELTIGGTIRGESQGNTQFDLSGGSSQIHIGGALQAVDGGNNSFNTDYNFNGGPITMAVEEGIVSQAGTNNIELHRRASSLTIGEEISTTEGGRTRIYVGEDNNYEASTIHVNGSITTQGYGSSLLLQQSSGSGNVLSVTGNVTTTDGAKANLENYSTGSGLFEIGGDVVANGYGSSNTLVANSMQETTGLDINGQVIADAGSNTLTLTGIGVTAGLAGGMSAVNSGINKVDVTDWSEDGVTQLRTGSISANYGENDIRIHAYSTEYQTSVIDIIGGINAVAGQNSLAVSNIDKATVTIGGDLSALGVEGLSGRNTIDVGTTQNAYVAIAGSIISENNASTFIGMSSGTDRALSIAGDVIAAGYANNTIGTYGAQNSHITIDGSMVAGAGGSNMVEAGAGSLSIIGKLLASGNEESSGNNFMHIYGDSLVAINGGMEAENYGSRNEIQSSFGDQIFMLKGMYTASGEESYNLINAGDGNDQVLLEGQVATGGLTLIGGDGYDELTLTAANADAFNANYRGWLEAAGSDAATPFSDWGWESVRVEVTESLADLASLSWLNSLVTSAGGSEPIDLELNVDRFGQSFNLGEFFAGRDEDIFTALNMGGQEQNTLVVNGTLADNNIEDYIFKVHGDSEDTVQLGNEWFYIGDDGGSAEGPSYSFYTSGYDLLMIESEVNVIFGA